MLLKLREKYTVYCFYNLSILITIILLLNQDFFYYYGAVGSFY